MRFWSLPAANLLRNATRSFLTVAGISVAVGSFLSLLGLCRGMQQSWLDALQQRGTDILAVQKGAINMVSATLDEGLAERIRRVDGVASVAGELLELVELETGVVSMVSGWADDSSLWAIQSMSDGSRPGPQNPDGVVLGQTIAELSGKRVGDTFEISDHAFRVSGIFSARDLRSARSIVVRLASLQELMGKRGEVTMFNIRLVHPDNAAQSSAIQDRLTRGFPNLRFTRTETAADNDMVFLLLRSLAWGISLIGLITALVLILNTLLMSVLERKTEIGVLAAVGWQTGRIVAMVVSEGVLLSTMGGILGVGLGQVALQWLARMPKILGVESPQFTWETAAEIGTATLLLSILGSAYPAWRAARLNAVDALRAE